VKQAVPGTANFALHQLHGAATWPI